MSSPRDAVREQFFDNFPDANTFKSWKTAIVAGLLAQGIPRAKAEGDSSSSGSGGTNQFETNWGKLTFWLGVATLVYKVINDIAKGEAFLVGLVKYMFGFQLTASELEQLNNFRQGVLAKAFIKAMRYFAGKIWRDPAVERELNDFANHDIPSNRQETSSTADVEGHPHVPGAVSRMMYHGGHVPEHEPEPEAGGASGTQHEGTGVSSLRGRGRGH